MPRKKKLSAVELAEIVDAMLEIVRKLDQRLTKLERAERIARPIGFSTDCVSNQEIHEYLGEDPPVPDEC